MGLAQGWGRLLSPRGQPHGNRSMQGTKLNIRGCWTSKDLKQREPDFLKRNFHGASMEASLDTTGQAQLSKEQTWRGGGGRVGWTPPNAHWTSPSATQHSPPSARGVHFHSTHFLLVLSGYLSPRRLNWKENLGHYLLVVTIFTPTSFQNSMGTWSGESV